MTFGEITTQFTGLMNRRDLTSNTALVSTFLQQSITRIKRKLRVPGMLTSYVITVDGSYTNAIPIPALYKQLSTIEVSNSHFDDELILAPISDVRTLALTVGTPMKYSRFENTWVLGPYPDTSTVITIEYYGAWSALSVAADTNELTQDYADLVLYGALSFAGDYYNDKRAASWEARFESITSEITEEADRERLASNAAVSPAYTFNDGVDDQG